MYPPGVQIGWVCILCGASRSVRPAVVRIIDRVGPEDCASMPSRRPPLVSIFRLGWTQKVRCAISGLNDFQALTTRSSRTRHSLSILFRVPGIPPAYQLFRARPALSPVTHCSPYMKRIPGIIPVQPCVITKHKTRNTHTYIQTTPTTHHHNHIHLHTHYYSCHYYDYYDDCPYFSYYSHCYFYFCCSSCS